MEDDLRSEYDLAELLKDGVRGKYPNGIALASIWYLLRIKQSGESWNLPQIQSVCH
jgi:hypothetical protein